MFSIGEFSMMSSIPVVEGASVRELPGARVVTLTHRGPYEELRNSYARILKYAKERGYEITSPTSLHQRTRYDLPRQPEEISD